jgi:hypothetical protein
VLALWGYGAASNRVLGSFLDHAFIPPFSEEELTALRSCIKLALIGCVHLSITYSDLILSCHPHGNPSCKKRLRLRQGPFRPGDVCLFSGGQAHCAVRAGWRRIAVSEIEALVPSVNLV